MSKCLVSTMAAVVLGWVGLQAGARAQPIDLVGLLGARLAAEDLLPADTLVYSIAPNLERAVEAWRTTALAKMLAHPEIRQLLTRIESTRKRKRSGKDRIPALYDLLSQAGVTGGRFMEVFPRQVAWALLPVRGEPRWAFLAACEEETQRDQAGDLVERFFSQLFKYVPVDVTSDSYKEIPVTTYETGIGSYAYAFIGNLFAFGQGRETIEELIEQALGSGRPALAKQASFTALRRELGTGSHLFLQVDLGAVRKLVVKKAAATAAEGKTGLLQKLSLLAQSPAMALGVLGASMQFEGKGIRDRFVYRPSGRGAFLPAVGRAALKARTAKYVPLDARGYVALNLNLKLLLESVREIMQGLPLGKLLSGVTASEQAGRYDLVRDVLDIFNGEVGVAWIPTGNRVTAVLILEVREVRSLVIDQAIEHMINSLESRSGRKPNRTVNAEHQIAHLQPDKPVKLLGLPFPCSAIAVSEAKDFVLLSSNLDALRKAVRQSRFDTSSILNKPDYQAVHFGFPQDVRKNLIAYLDLKRAVEAAYWKMLPMLQAFAQRYGFRWDLPIDDIVAEHLFGMSVQARIEESLYIEAFSPLGQLTAAGALALAIRRPSDPKSGRSGIVRKLKAIAIGLHLYAADFDRFPLKLSELHPIYLVNKRVFLKPGSKQKLVTREDIDEKSDFIYSPGHTLADLSDTILLYERSPGQKGRYVVYLNGRVERINHRHFQFRMKEDGIEIQEERDHVDRDIKLFDLP